MNAIDRIKAAQQADERSSHYVERWGTTVFFKKMTPRDVDNITKKYPDFMQNPTMPAMIESIVLRAENEDGTRMFDIGDKPTLMSEPVDVINDLVVAMSPRPDVEAIEKN